MKISFTSKSLIISVLILLCSSLAHSQDTLKIKEIGLGINTGSNVSLTYKVGKENSVYRFTPSFYVSNANQANSMSIVNSGIGLAVGIEKTKVLNNDFKIYYGPELNESLAFSLATSNNATHISSTISGFLGVRYKLNDKFNISFETQPFGVYIMFLAPYSFSDWQTSYGFNLSFLSNCYFKLFYRL
jgi:hypothetical protein